MKQLRFYKHGIAFISFSATSVLVPHVAFAGKAACEDLAQVTFQKKSVAMEFSVIAGDLSEIEAADARMKLQAGLSQEKENCRRVVSAARAPTARSESGNL